MSWITYAAANRVPILLKGGGSSGGGGGNSGEVDWPDYLKDRHKKWLSSNEVDDERVNMDQAIEEAWDASPYTDGYTYDPTEDLASMRARLSAFELTVDSIDPQGDFEAYFDTAIAKLDEIVGIDANAEIVRQFDESQRPALMRAVGRFSAGMADIGAINSSAYIIGLALMENEHLRQIARVNADLALQEKQRKNNMVLQAVAMMMQELQFRSDLERVATSLNTEIRRITIVAHSEFLSRDLEIASKDASWNLEIWQYASNLLAAVQGGTSIPGSGTQGDVHQGPSMLGGVLSGAASGAMISSMLGAGSAMGGAAGTGIASGAASGGMAGVMGGPWGIAIGAGIGAIAGGLMA